jgi:uncharacterized protein YcbK (DUF882 family)
MERRRFLLTGVSAIACFSLPSLVQAADPNRWVLRLERLDDGEEITAPFTRDGRTLYYPGYKQLCRVLRDDHVPTYEGWVKIPIKTIEVLWDVQQYLTGAGIKDPIVVHSGYRTAQTNANTEGAAWMSLHMFGKAVDFHVPGVSLYDLAAICRACPIAGGVGYYPEGWIHIDTGPVRSWIG